MPAKTDYPLPTMPVPMRAVRPTLAWLGWSAAILALGGMAWATWDCAPWVMMWAITGTQFMALKLAALRGPVVRGQGPRLAGFLLAWAGMNAREFLAPSSIRRPAPGIDELVFAAAKLLFGLVLAVWCIYSVDTHIALFVGWVGMVGLIFTLHFGLFHVASWVWRAAGVNAPPIMRAPIAATSLAELWGGRWNEAFTESARRLIMRPLARRWGTGPAGFAVFLISGLVHETAISLPARGGWGGPTLYFLLQALGIAAEKSALGLRLGLGCGVCGWLWTFLIAAGPLPLLFHLPFVRHVIVPFYRSLAALLP